MMNFWKHCLDEEVKESWDPTKHFVFGSDATPEIRRQIVAEAVKYVELFPEKTDCPPAAKVEPIDCVPVREDLRGTRSNIGGQPRTINSSKSRCSIWRRLACT
jgi:hypothetical protein